MKKIILFSSLIVSSTLAFEEFIVTDVEAKYSHRTGIETTKTLQQSFNLGFSNTTGNTETINLNAKYDLLSITSGYHNRLLKIAFDTSAFFTESEEIRTNEEYVANLELEQIMSREWLTYGELNWLKNPKFRNYDNKIGIGMGMGNELYNDGKQSFALKLGISYNIEDYANAQETEKFGALNEYLEYNNKLNAISSLYLKGGAMQNFEDMGGDYEIIGVLGVGFAVANNVNLSLEGEVDYDNLPAIGFKKTDTKSIVRLGYNF